MGIFSEPSRTFDDEFSTGCDLSEEETLGHLWYFPDGLFLLIPVFLTTISFLLLFFTHVKSLSTTSLIHLRFQALYVRLVSAFPFLALLALFGAFWPHLAKGFEVLYSFFEAYVMLCFFAILTGWGWSSIDWNFGEEILLSNSATSRFCRCCGPYFENGRKAFIFLKITVFQIVVIRPLASIILFFLEEFFSDLSEILLLFLLFNIVAAISLFLALGGLIRLYVTLRSHPTKPLSGQKAAGKFIVAKTLFTFLIFNSLLIEPLIAWDVIPIPGFLCTEPVMNCSERNLFNCQFRFVNFIFLIELTLLSPLALYYFQYRHHSNLNEQTGHKEPSFSLFVFYILRFWDLPEFWKGKVRSIDESTSFLLDSGSIVS